MKNILSLLFTICLLVPPHILYAGGVCRSVVPSKDLVKERMASYFKNQSEKFSQQIVDQLFNKLEGKTTLNENDIYQLSRKYYKSLMGPRFKSLFNSFKKNKLLRNHELTTQFHGDLIALLKESGSFQEVDGRWDSLANNWHHKMSHILSWSKYVAVHSLGAFLSFKMTGDFTVMPLYIPPLFVENFSATNRKKVALSYYSNVLNKTIVTLLSVKLATMALDLDVRSEFLLSMQSSLFEQAGLNLEGTSQAFDLDSFVAESDAAMANLEKDLKLKDEFLKISEEIYSE